MALDLGSLRARAVELRAAADSDPPPYDLVRDWLAAVEALLAEGWPAHAAAVEYDNGRDTLLWVWLARRRRLVILRGDGG